MGVHLMWHGCHGMGVHLMGCVLGISKLSHCPAGVGMHMAANMAVVYGCAHDCVYMGTPHTQCNLHFPSSLMRLPIWQPCSPYAHMAALQPH